MLALALELNHSEVEAVLQRLSPTASEDDLRLVVAVLGREAAKRAWYALPSLSGHPAATSEQLTFCKELLGIKDDDGVPAAVPTSIR